jgi:cytochrome c peroxidase
MSRIQRFLFAAAVPTLLLGGLTLYPSYADNQDTAVIFPDQSGVISTFSLNGKIDLTNPFFQSLGSNGRSCFSCHQPQDAWSVTPEHVQARFESTQGRDPIFRTVDGSNSPLADVSTVSARRKAYSMLLNRGVIRIGIGIPASAEFSLAAVDDPYQYASAQELSLFRRPLPSTNLRFLTAIMWDGRETSLPFVPPMDPGKNMTDLTASLKQQAIDAVLNHGQATSLPTDTQVEQILAFEMGLSTAQIFDQQAGYLNGFVAIGGPRILAHHEFYVGVNDTLGADPTGAAFQPTAMSLFSAWDHPHDDGMDGQGEGRRLAARRQVARGEKLFNTRPIQITGVGGLNDALNLPVIQGTCTTCHSTPNVGNHSVGLPINIGIADASRRTPDMPLYTLRNKTTGVLVQTTDPGRAMITGKWADIGKFKGPILRGLGARAPYFHNGSAATFEDVLTFYDTRFNMGLTAQEKSDLIAFLHSL